MGRGRKRERDEGRKVGSEERRNGERERGIKEGREVEREGKEG